MAGDDDGLVIMLPDDVSGPLVDTVAHQPELGGDGGGKIDRGDDDEDPALDLKRQMTAMQARVTRAETTAAEATRIAETAVRDRDEALVNVSDSQLDTIVSGINAAKAEAEAAEMALADAHERGDARGIAKATSLLTQASARLVPLEMAKGDLEAEKKARPKPQPRQDQPQRAAPLSTDPVEAYLQTRSPTSQQWLRKNKQFVGADGPDKRLVAAHYAAIAADLSADTPEYFEHVEQQLGLKQVAKTPQQDVPAIQRRPSAPSAPVNNTGGGLNGGARQVTLTPGERRSATDGTLVWNYDDESPQKRFKKGDPIGISEMARRKMLMTAEGQYDKTLQS